MLAQAAAELDEYFAGTRQEFDVPLDPHGSPFQLGAWRGLTTIPFAETVSYGEQARRLGHDGKARAIGAANGSNPLPVIVPCHRVIGSDGSLTGFGGGLETKAWLLHHERRGRRPRAAPLIRARCQRRCVRRRVQAGAAGRGDDLGLRRLQLVAGHARRPSGRTGRRGP